MAFTIKDIGFYNQPNNIIIGPSDAIGTYNSIIGHRNNIHGDYNIIMGSGNIVVGSYNIVLGHNITIFGNNFNISNKNNQILMFDNHLIYKFLLLTSLNILPYDVIKYIALFNFDINQALVKTYK